MYFLDADKESDGDADEMVDADLEKRYVAMHISLKKWFMYDLY